MEKLKNLSTLLWITVGFKILVLTSSSAFLDGIATMFLMITIGYLFYMGITPLVELSSKISKDKKEDKTTSLNE